MKRLASWAKWSAAAFVAAIALLAIPAQPSGSRAATNSTASTYKDTLLYQTIAERVSRGENYYPVAASEHRAHNFPIAPPQVFREPTLSWLAAVLGGAKGLLVVLISLCVITALATRNALEREGMPSRYRVPAVVVMTAGLWVVAVPLAGFIHEAWAGILIALSIATYRPGKWPLPLTLALLACFFRELAFPYLGVMFAFALLERRWREALGWLLGGFIFAALYAVHLLAASRLYVSGDAISPGWLSFGGPSFVLETARRDVILHLLPPWLGAFAICLAAVGFAGSRNPIVLRAGLVCGGYMVAFLFIGRPENAYWGMLYAPLLPLGLVLAPATIYRLVTNLAVPAKGDPRATTRSP